MFGQGPLKGFRVPGKRISDIRQTAERARAALGITFPIRLGHFLERLSIYSITRPTGRRRSVLDSRKFDAMCYGTRLRESVP
jgi:hypothetical protein